MKFTLQIDLDTPNAVLRIAGSLRRVANLFSDARYRDALSTVATSQDEGKIRDVDGRVVGTWRIAQEAAEPQPRCETWAENPAEEKATRDFRTRGKNMMGMMGMTYVEIAKRAGALRDVSNEDFIEKARLLIQQYDEGLINAYEVEGGLSRTSELIDLLEKGEELLSFGSCCCSAGHAPVRTFKVEITIRPHGYLVKRCGS